MYFDSNGDIVESKCCAVVRWSARLLPLGAHVLMRAAWLAVRRSAVVVNDNSARGSRARGLFRTVSPSRIVDLNDLAVVAGDGAVVRVSHCVGCGVVEDSVVGSWL